MAAVQFRTPQRIILLLYIVGRIISEPIITSSCADVSIKEGESTSLQCTFTEDIVNLHKDFKVDLYPNTADTPVPLLLCHWSHLEKLDCYEHDGYTYEGYERNTVTVNILRASREDTGKYACVLLSYSTPGTYEQCTLTVQALKESPSTSDTTIQTANNKSNGPVQDPDTSGSVSWKIVLGALLVIIVLLVITIIFLFIKKRWTANENAKKQGALLTNKTNNPNDAR